LNIYDTKIVVCMICKKAIGEIELDSIMIGPLCGQCASIEDKTYNTVKYQQDDFGIKTGQVV